MTPVHSAQDAKKEMVLAGVDLNSESVEQSTNTKK